MPMKDKLNLKHWTKISILLLIYDFLAITACYFIALWIRFDGRFSLIDPDFLQTYTHTIFWYALFCVVVFWLMRLYRSIWRFASYSELVRTFVATMITCLSYFVVMAVFHLRMPLSYYIIGFVLQFIATLGIRFLYRFILLVSRQARNITAKEKRVMIVGAGAAGQMIRRDVSAQTRINEKIVCFIDDNPNKWGRYIDGVPVLGNRDKIQEAVKKYDIHKIYIAIPSASNEARRQVLRICNETECELMNLPGMYQLYTGEVTVSKMKPVQIEDLLGREQIQTDLQEVYAYLADKTVMVTGVGSIGSELARQIAQHHPKKLILFDVYENNAYDIQQELKKKYPYLNLVTIIGSVRDSRKLFEVFDTYHPDIVYHSAAHKHVPLMEDVPCETIKNNVIGTYKTAYAAMCNGCKKFVLISTDKAVNPTNIMGASKRACEMVIQSFDKLVKEGKADQIPQIYAHEILNDEEKAYLNSRKECIKKAKTEFAAVRFGNVLSSNGSVIPLFKKQIAAGGPVTVTHPDIIRYFMTISEAVSLVLLAGTYGEGGEIFILDMGEPVKIDTLARNLIRLSGYKPDEDIKIVYCGLRPGEKLYEEKLMSEEGLRKTANNLIHVGNPIKFDTQKFLDQLVVLFQEANDNDPLIKEKMMEVVTTYHPYYKEG